MSLTGPNPYLGTDACRRQLAGAQLRVVQQHFGAGNVNKCRRQAGFDMVERLIEVFGPAVDHVLGSGRPTHAAKASNARAGNIASVPMLGWSCLGPLASCSNGEMATIAAGFSSSHCSRCASASAR